MNRIILTLYFAVVCIPCELAVQCRAQSAPQPIAIDANAPGTPFPAFLGADVRLRPRHPRLREAYRNDLRAVKQVTDFRYVRFHAILHDEVGVYDEDEHGNPVYNFSYVDQIYDGLLANGVRPSSRSASCRRSWLRSRTHCIPSGTSRTSRRPRTTRSGTA